MTPSTSTAALPTLPMTASTDPSRDTSAPFDAASAHPPHALRRWARHAGVGGLLAWAVLIAWLLATAFGPWLVNQLGLLARSGDIQVYGPVSAAHWLGTDYLGRDMLARVLLGARHTVGVALLATLLASGLGTVLALVAATGGRVLDAALSRSLDTLTAIPNKMLALIMVAAFGSSVTMLVLTAAVIYVPGAFRIARSMAVNINELDYVVVARTRGERLPYIMRREILPNIAGTMLADLGLRFVYVVLLLASLSFLGLGIQPPDADWGSLVRENMGALADGGAAVIAPALAIASLTIAVSLVIDTLPGRAGRHTGAH